MTDFYRPEVVSHLQRRVAGSVRLDRPLPLTALAALAVAVAVCGGALFATGKPSRKISLEGFLRADPGGGDRVDFMATAADVRLLRAGQALDAHFRPFADADDGEVVPGVLLAVPGSPITVDERIRLPAPFAAQAARGPVYRVTARIDASSARHTAGPGARVDAEVQVGRRPLLRWRTGRQPPA